MKLIAAMIEALGNSTEQLASQITDVQYAKMTDDYQNKISFKVKGIAYEGILRGRNKDFVLGFGGENRIALRVLIDGDAKKITE